VLCPGRFNEPDPHRERPIQLGRDWLELLETQNYTLAWRHLVDAAKGHEQPFNLWHRKYVPHLAVEWRIYDGV
jgi:hypothetical protein